jgi:MFS family permease
MLHWLTAATGTPPTTTGSGSAFSFTPDPSALPDTSVLQHLTNGLGFWVLIATLVGLLIGAATWALGHYSQNYQQAYTGRRGVLISGAAALLVGAGPHILSFLVQRGSGS